MSLETLINRLENLSSNLVYKDIYVYSNNSFSIVYTCLSNEIFRFLVKDNKITMYTRNKNKLNYKEIKSENRYYFFGLLKTSLAKKVENIRNSYINSNKCSCFNNYTNNNTYININ